MCINLRETDSNKPYNESKTRYKIVFVGKDISSPYVRTQKWVLDEWVQGHHVPNDYSGPNTHGEHPHPVNHGIHVFITLQDAEMVMRHIGHWNYRIAEMEVDDFIASGAIGPFMNYPYKSFNAATETWKRAKLVKLTNVANLDVAVECPEVE